MTKYGAVETMIRSTGRFTVRLILKLSMRYTPFVALRCFDRQKLKVPLVGHVGKQGWQKGFKLVLSLGSQKHDQLSFERCYPMTTAGRWPWKPASAKKCVTAYQPNGVALKMDGIPIM